MDVAGRQPQRCPAARQQIAIKMRLLLPILAGLASCHTRSVEAPAGAVGSAQPGPAIVKDETSGLLALEIISRPAGTSAKLTIDGKDYDINKAEFVLPIGEHNVALEGAGVVSFSRVVSIQPNATTRLRTRIRKRLAPRTNTSKSCPSDMAVVPGAEFVMGNDDGAQNGDARHSVRLSGYCMDVGEVTVDDYVACAKANKCNPPASTQRWNGMTENDRANSREFCNFGHDDRLDHPMNCVDWFDANSFCAWKGKRLPTEAEWEYAAVGGDGRSYPWGNDAPDGGRANACGQECSSIRPEERHNVTPLFEEDDGAAITAPVGSYPDGASPFGVLDMAGNVREWTADWYAPYATGLQVNPKGPANGSTRSARGGSWDTWGVADFASAFRTWFGPSVRVSNLGFRCARSTAP